MNKELSTLRLGQIGSVRMCKRVLKEQTSESEEIPFFKISTFGDKPDTYISKELFEEYVNKYSYPQKGDILISAAGTLGKIVIFDGKPSYFQDSNIVWIENDEKKLINEYLYYFYKTNPWETTNGSTINRIYNDNLRNIKVTFPKSIQVQQKIAKVLSDLDAKIELNNRINAELEAMAKLVYEYWFVQFDFPVGFDSAQASGSTQSNPDVTLSEVEGYKSSGGKMVWNEELKREIPEGWEVLDLEKIEDNIITGKTPPTTNEEYYNGDIPFICIGDVRGNMHIVKTEITLSEAGANTQRNKFIPKGAICVTCIASPGLVGFATKDSQTNQQLNSIICNNPENRYYLYFYLTNYFQFAKAKTGNTFANMNKGDFSTIKVLKPPRDLLNDFTKVLESSIDKILNNTLENQQLSSLRDWLLPMLMNGQVSVAEAEERLEEELGMVAEREREEYGPK
ncbi:restriction endonuclease subunit S [Algoriphagus hitonicola]|uniref:Type I restriction enzyme, S subunit n=1 Tax=Algoriphagus hitonicola TaxID=435880 RepID=A0A1I2NUW3_9BACT|nr:restriction endonuclease subunit S [Algoriphagus hitonicola]SFG07313.1 type I restriction enzyme, S subunit [Algoriphagus hitonicola]